MTTWGDELKTLLMAGLNAVSRDWLGKQLLQRNHSGFIPELFPGVQQLPDRLQMPGHRRRISFLPEPGVADVLLGLNGGHAGRLQFQPGHRDISTRIQGCDQSRWSEYFTGPVSKYRSLRRASKGQEDGAWKLGWLRPQCEPASSNNITQTYTCAMTSKACPLQSASAEIG